MKKLSRHLLAILLLMTAFGSRAGAQDTTSQSGDGRTFQAIFDSLAGGLIPDRVPYGLLYDRVIKWYDPAQPDTLSQATLYQAWWDVENSRVAGAPLHPYDTMRAAVAGAMLQRSLPLLLVDCYYGALDTLAFTDGRIDTTGGFFTDNGSGAPPYTTGRLLLAGLPATSLYAIDTYTITLDTAAYSLSNSGAALQSITLTDLTEHLGATLRPGDTYQLTFSLPGAHTLQLSVQLAGGFNFTRTQLIIVNGGTAKGTGNCLVDHNKIESDIPFKGYDESYATTSWADYHIYYHYLPGSTDCERILRKPIVILDGFDPGDGRNFDQLYNDKLQYTYNSSSVKLGDELRALGYDIVILNFPTLGEMIPGTSLTIPTTLRKGTAGSLTVDPVSHAGRDGGADYMERNAFLLVKLMQVLNAQLTANGSTEKLVVVGPSMGGQISRYALRYMEKNSLPHNCRLWCAFDSPNLGANIPVGLQADIWYAGYISGNQTAKDDFDQQLRSYAARQLLIHQTGRDIATYYAAPIQSLTHPGVYTHNINFTEPARNTWQSAIDALGYPANLRKIALLNGASGGNRFTPCSTIIDYQFQKVAWPHKGLVLFELSGNVVPGYNQTCRIYYAKVHGGDTYDANYHNSQPGGSLDGIAGSLYNAIGRFKAALPTSDTCFAQAVIGIFGVNAHRKIVSYIGDTHTFIPTVSSLGFFNSNFTWSNTVNDRNLVCSNEIPFDNYFLPATNEPHITLTEKNVAWLKQELLKNETHTGCPKICSFKIINGGDLICNGTNYTYNLDVVPPAGSTIVWALSGGLQEVSHTSSSITVQATANSLATIKATISSDCEADVLITRQVTTINLSQTISGNIQSVNACASQVYTPYYPGVTYLWQDNLTMPGFFPGSNTFWFMNNEGLNVDLKYQTSCGTTASRHFSQARISSGNCPVRQMHSNGSVATNAGNAVAVAPNPANSAWTFSFTNKDRQPLSIIIVDALGRKVYNSAIADPNTHQVPCIQLAPGLYIATLHFSDGGQEKVKIIKE